MKRIYKSIEVASSEILLTLALFSDVGGTESVDAADLDRLEALLSRPNYTGAEQLPVANVQRSHLELTNGGEVLAVLHRLKRGENIFVCKARYGTNISVQLTIDFVVTDPNETTPVELSEDVVLVESIGDGGGSGGGEDVGLVVRKSVSGADLEICDEAGNVIARLRNGGIETQNLKSELYGKRIINYGDSIAFGENSYRVAGDATTKGYSYAPMLADAIGGLCNNRAVSGYTISQILSRINDDSALADYDIAFLEGGTNDMSTSLAVGTVDMTNNDEPSSSPSTYAQYVERIMWVAKSRFVGGFVYWVLPHRMSTRTLSVQEAYWSVVKQAAAKWGVCVIDIYGNSCFTASPLSLGAEYTDFNDALEVTHGGTHPNTEGYKKYYLPIVYDTVCRTERKVLN